MTGLDDRKNPAFLSVIWSPEFSMEGSQIVEFRSSVCHICSCNFGYIALMKGITLMLSMLGLSRTIHTQGPVPRLAHSKSLLLCLGVFWS